MKGTDIARAGSAAGLGKPPSGASNILGASIPGEVLRRFGTPEEILAHEIGHQLDSKYGLNAWTKNPALRPELIALADLRASGQVSPEKQAYLRSEPELIANLVAGYLHAPELTRREAPNSFQAFDSFLQSHPETAPLRDVKPSLEIGQRERAMRLAGPMLTGHYYYPEPVARLLDNYTTPGLRGNRVYDVVREFGNVLNQAQLGFGAFHAGFVTMDTQISAVALGLQQLSRGQLLPGMANLMRSPLAPFRAFFQGSKVLSEYYAPGSQGAETAAIVQNLMEAGGRAKMDAFYGGTHVEALRQAIRDVRAGKGGYGSALYNALPALSEAVSKPVMEKLVPRMKLGVFADMARYEIDRLGPNAGPNERRAALGQAWDSVENRLGQMTYDNIFWNKTLKDLAMVGVRSVGWNLGTARELGGGLADIPSSMRNVVRGQGISPRLAYVVGLPLVTAFYGAIYQYLMTGRGPDELKDYFAPKTGRMNKDGTPERMVLPTYMRDVLHATNRADEGPARWAQNAGEMARGKLNPAVTTTAEMLFNRDFYGTAIRNPNDSAVRQAWDTAKHLLAAFKPFSVRAFQQGNRTPGTAAQALVGITPAPSYVTHSAEQQRQAEAGRKVELTPLQKRLRQQ
jgi:hypothetical protein